MANKKDFGERNKNLSEKLYQEKTYYDWSITTAFYSSIHFVEDFIFPTEIDGITCDNISDAKTAYKINGRHATREKLVFDKIKSTSDGGYIVCGYSISTNGTVTGPIGNYDYWILKLDSLGNIEWQKSLGGTNEDYATDILQTNDGGYIVIGDTKSTNGNVIGNHGLFDIWIVKLNNLGVIEWRKTYGGSNDDRISSQQGNFSIAQTLDGGYIFTTQTSFSPLFTVKSPFVDFVLPVKI
jgi:hypothetical protein